MPNIRAAVSVFQLTDFPTLVSKCRIFKANTKGKTVDTRIGDPVRQDRRPSRFSRGPYSSPNQSQVKRTISQEDSSGGSSSFRRPLKCFKCGGPHIKKNCPQLPPTCDICGKMGHYASVCWSAPQKRGSMSVVQRPESRASIGTKPTMKGKVFAMSGAETSKSEELIRGKCIIKYRLLDVLFDSGATYSFISVDCMRCLELPLSELSCDVIVSTSMGKPVATSFVCLGCPVMVHGRSFSIDLICLPLSQLDIILGMDWLSSNHVLLDCKEKILIFGTKVSESARLLSPDPLGNVMSAKAFMVLFLIETENEMKPEYILVVRDFLQVFLDDVIKLPPE
ncbi:uncharacterized protein LOC113862339 [Abrus precatorius]|uniref:Uncharacterized protein LOC113862339 n=1 Tax=Abrus precatorius TaxID=3816 RepID=A0A8B8L4V9_ABRPR|nr:uncharacterized protein LOC113862339 [Abrus precatorius]